jgi:hypothetical protein
VQLAAHSSDPAFDAVSAAQSVHSVAAAAAYLPAAHVVHSVAPAAENVPTAQLVQAVAEVSAELAVEYVPAVQGAQASLAPELVN